MAFRLTETSEAIAGFGQLTAGTMAGAAIHALLATTASDYVEEAAIAGGGFVQIAAIIKGAMIMTFAAVAGTVGDVKSHWVSAVAATIATVTALFHGHEC